MADIVEAPIHVHSVYDIRSVSIIQSDEEIAFAMSDEYGETIPYVLDYDAARKLAVMLRGAVLAMDQILDSELNEWTVDA